MALCVRFARGQVTFNEPVTGVTTASFSLGGTASRGAVTVTQLTNINYRVSVPVRRVASRDLLLSFLCRASVLLSFIGVSIYVLLFLMLPSLSCSRPVAVTAEPV